MLPFFSKLNAVHLKHDQPGNIKFDTTVGIDEGQVFIGPPLAAHPLDALRRGAG